MVQGFKLLRVEIINLIIDAMQYKQVADKSRPSQQPLENREGSGGGVMLLFYLMIVRW